MGQEDKTNEWSSRLNVAVFPPSFIFFSTFDCFNRLSYSSAFSPLSIPFFFLSVSLNLSLSLLQELQTFSHLTLFPSPTGVLISKISIKLLLFTLDLSLETFTFFYLYIPLPVFNTLTLLPSHAAFILGIEICCLLFFPLHITSTLLFLYLLPFSPCSHISRFDLRIFMSL